MTLTYSQAKVVYQGDGETTQWSIPFPYLQTEDLQIVRISSDGAESVLTGDFVVDTDLHLVRYPMPDSLTPPLADGEKLMLRRHTPLTQQAAFAAQQAFDPSVLEAGYDKAMMIAQEQAEELSRAVRFPASAAGAQTDAAQYLKELQQAKQNADTANAFAQSSLTKAENALQTAQQAVQNAQDSAATVASGISSAQAAQTAAETAQNAAENAAALASASADGAALSSSSAAVSAALAQKWAVKTDGAVEGGEYSAKYHAQQATSSATAASGSAATAATQATNAADSAALAQKWATQTTAEVVSGQGYGAKYYAEAAADHAAQAASSASAAAQSAQEVAGKANNDLSNVSQLSQQRIDGIMPAAMDYVVESYNDGTNWYRKYKSGFIEQGGKLTNTAATWYTVTYTTAFSSIVLYAGCSSIRSSSGANGMDYVWNVTLTTCQVLPEAGAGVYWHACGY